MTIQELTQMTLKELRSLDSEIKANSRASWIEKYVAKAEEADRVAAADNVADIIVNGAEIVEPDMVAKIKTFIPEYFNKAIASETGCECWEDNLIWFYFIMGGVNAAIQDAIIQLGREKNLGKWARRTTCPPCLKTRVDTVKRYIDQNINVNDLKG